MGNKFSRIDTALWNKQTNLPETLNSVSPKGIYLNPEVST